jgi:hypothetical protein
MIHYIFDIFLITKLAIKSKNLLNNLFHNFYIDSNIFVLYVDQNIINWNKYKIGYTANLPCNCS